VNNSGGPELFTSRGCRRYEKAERTGKTGTSGKAVKFKILVKILLSSEILMWLKRAQVTPEFHLL